jgi:hypothetical protein
MEWIYEYWLETPIFKIAVLKKKYRINPKFNDRHRLIIEYKKLGDWKTKYFLPKSVE